MIRRWNVSTPGSGLVAPTLAPDKSYLVNALRQMQNTQKQPISSVGGGIANALTQGLQGYFAGQRAREDVQARQQEAQQKIDLQEALRERERKRSIDSNQALVDVLAAGRGMEQGGPVDTGFLPEGVGYEQFTEPEPVKADPRYEAMSKFAQAGGDASMLLNKDAYAMVTGDPATGKLSERDKKLQQYSSITGLPVDDPRVVGLVDKQYDITTTAQGDPVIVNKVDPSDVTYLEDLTGSEKDTEATSSETAPKDDPETLWNSIEGVWGPVGGVVDVTNRVAGLAGYSVAPEIQANRDKFNLWQKELTDSFQDSSRYVQGEVQDILNGANISTTMWNSEPNLKIRLREIDTMMKRKIDEIDERAKDKSLSKKDRQNLRFSAGRLEDFRKQLGVPKEKKWDYEDGQTATNPETGERVIHKDGKWVPM